jgi:sugar phosphate isomerase/epimerase
VKFGAQLEAFGDGDLAARLALAKRLGCEGLEVNLSVGKLGPGGSVAPLLVEAARLRATFRQAGLECIALTPGIGLPAARDPAAVRAACEAAAALGTRQLRLFSAPYVRWGGPGSRLPPGFEDYDLLPQKSVGFRVRLRLFRPC